MAAARSDHHVLSFSSLAIHADDHLSALDPHGPIVPAISVSTTYRHPPSYNDWPRNVDHVALDPHEPTTHVYARDSSPVLDRVEVVVAALESASPVKGLGAVFATNTLPPSAYAIAYGSGLNAVHAMFVYYQPRRVIKSRAGYFGSEAAAQTYKRGRNVEIVYLDTLVPPSGSKHDLYESQPGDLVLLESPMNPTNDLEDLEWWTSRRAERALVAVDGTFAPPPLQFPLRHGIDIVMHSTTKYLGGHSDLMGGVLVVTNPKAAMGLRLDRTDNGWQPGALETHLLLRSLRSLPLRVLRQSSTATQLASWLMRKGHSKDQDALDVVDKVLHTSVEGTKGSEVAGKYLVGGHPACFSVVFKNNHYARLSVLYMRLFANATSLGGVESLAEWRHAVDADTHPGLVRLSVGLEDFEDLRRDLASAFRRAKEEGDKML